MQKKTKINLAIFITGLIAYGIIRADAWNLLLFSENTTGIIEQIKEMNSDPHTTSLKVRVKYSFTAADAKTYQGYGDRVLRENENTSDLSWLVGTGIDIVYYNADPSLNNVSGREYAVLFPLVLIPFVFGIDAFISRRSREDS